MLIEIFEREKGNIFFEKSKELAISQLGHIFLLKKQVDFVNKA